MGRFAETTRKIENIYRKDERSVGERVLFGGLALLSLMFTIIFFGPLDIFLSNSSEFGVDFFHMFTSLGVFFVVSYLLLLIPMLFLKGFFLDRIAVGLVILALEFYIQGTFLNNLGALTGGLPTWHLMSTDAFINLFIWLIVYFFVRSVLFVFEDMQKQIIIFISVLLLSMQGAALVSEAITYDANAGSYFSGEREYEVAEKNVLVFVVDSLTNEDLDKALSFRLDMKEMFKDFTIYNNCNSEYQGTFPGLLHLITGFEYEYDKSYDENIDKAWADASEFYDALSKKEYDIEIYTDDFVKISGRQPSRVSSFCSNVLEYRKEFPGIKTLAKYIKLSLYRYMPHMAKACFWSGGGGAAYNTTREYPSKVDSSFISGLRADGLSVSTEYVAKIAYFHLNGAHEPFDIDSFGNYVPDGTNELEVSAGYLRGIGEYLEKMKELGVYDDSIIIVTADHGKAVNPQCAFMIKDIANTQNEICEDKTPIEQRMLLPTLNQMLDLRCEGLVGTIYDGKEKGEYARKYVLFDYDPEYPDTKKSINIAKEFVYEGDSKTIKDMVANNDYYKIYELEEPLF